MIKCKKCGLYFRDRLNKAELEYDRTLCRNCRFVCEVLRLMIESFGSNIKINRIVTLNLNDVKIESASKRTK